MVTNPILSIGETIHNKTIMTKPVLRKILGYVRNNFIILIILVVILLIGNVLRSYFYSSVPHPGEVADEYAWGWLGLSLVQNHVPSSWSLISAYRNINYEKIDVDSIYEKNPAIPLFRIVKPDFDQPPLFGLMVGAYSYLQGAREFKDVSVIFLRRPMLKIAVLTSILIYFFAQRLFGRFVGLLAVFLYSVIPTFIISSRLALIENGYIPIFLGSLIFAELYFRSHKKWHWMLAVTLISIGILFKLAAISIAISLLLIVLYKNLRDRKFLITSLVISVIAPIILFASYGAYYDWNTFLDVFVKNASRFYGASSEILLQVVVQMRITTTKFLTDGWLIISWVSFFFLILGKWKKIKNLEFLVIPVISYLVILVLFGGESYGWYKFPLFPFLVVSLAVVLREVYLNLDFEAFFLLLLLPFGSSVHRLIGVMEFQKFALPFRAFAVVALATFAYMLYSRRNLQMRRIVIRLFMLAMFLFVVYLSIREILYLNYDVWFSVT